MKIKLNCTLLFLIFSVTSTYALEKKPFKFGIVPQQAATKLIEVWMPLIENLKKKCSCEIEFATAVDISTFEENIKKGEYDMAYLNPFHFIAAAEPNGYSVLVTEKDRKLKGILVVSQNSELQSIQDLKDAKIAFPGPTAFAASILVQQLFVSEKVKIEPIFVKSHESVYTGVISGLFKAGGGINRTYEALPEDQKKQLKILSITSEVTPHPIVIHKRVDVKISKQIEEALLELNNSENGKQILANLDFKGLKKPATNAWDDVRKMTKGKEQAPAEKR